MSEITKKAIAYSIKKLMKTKPFEKISVRDICNECGINRKSFYYHFKDKYNLINWIFYSECVQNIENNNVDTAWDFLEYICNYFYENRDFYIKAFKITGQNSFNEYFIDFFHPLALDYLKNQFEGGKNDKFYALFFADAYRLAIIRWLNDYPEVKPNEIVNLIKEAIYGVAKKYKDEI